jgi:hypothetical protein
VEGIYLCELCQSAYEPEAINGARKLKEFQGYTIDLRLQQFRKFIFGKQPEFIEFTSTKGQKLLAQMHGEAMQQARTHLDDLEKRLHTSFEKFLKRQKQRK